MRSIDDYSDDELQRLAQKMEGVQGGKDRLAAIRAALTARGVEGEQPSLFPSLDPTISKDDAQDS
jgi:hypothetical protein